MPRWLHIRNETFGASIKAKLSRPKTLPNKPSSHHLRRTTASKKSLFIGPTKSQTRYIHTNITKFSLFSKLHSLTLHRRLCSQYHTDDHRKGCPFFTNPTGTWTSLYWKSSRRSQILTISASSETKVAF